MSWRFEGIKPIVSARAPAGFDSSALLLMGAIVRSVEIAGALETILSLSVRYANERVAFERKIGKFQAVQQNLARLAGETAAALAAAGSAADTVATFDKFDDVVLLEAASAKIRCGEAAAEGAAIAHQVHGALGFTKEHVLASLHAAPARRGATISATKAIGRRPLAAWSRKRRSAGFWPMLASR